MMHYPSYPGTTSTNSVTAVGPWASEVAVASLHVESVNACWVFLA